MHSLAANCDGIGAAWVEALEKPQESNVFLQCVQYQIDRAEGPMGVWGWSMIMPRVNCRPGFGLQVDVPRLRKLCSAYCSI